MLLSFLYFNGMISSQRSLNLLPTLGEQHEAGLGWVLITNFSEFSLEDPSWEPSPFLTLAEDNKLRLDFWYASLLRVESPSFQRQCLYFSIHEVGKLTILAFELSLS